METRMKKKFLLTLLLISSSNYCTKAVRGCHEFGFFAEFMWVLNHLEWCVQNKVEPVIYWDSQSAYYSNEGYNNSKNVWEYYFEPVSSLSYAEGDHIHRDWFYDKNFNTMWWYARYVSEMSSLSEAEKPRCIQVESHDYLSSTFEAQRLDATGLEHPYKKSFRKYIKECLIDKFVHIKPNVQGLVDDFWHKNMAGKKTIGIHLRGRHLWGEVLPVPTHYLLKEANKYSALGYQFFIATDQKDLLSEAKKGLDGKVIFYDFPRADETTSPFKPGQLSPEQGLEVLIEALLLSKCDHFIHTLSQLSTTVLYFNPELDHTFIY